MMVSRNRHVSFAGERVHSVRDVVESEAVSKSRVASRDKIAENNQEKSRSQFKELQKMDICGCKTTKQRLGGSYIIITT